LLIENWVIFSLNKNEICERGWFDGKKVKLAPIIKKCSPE